MKIKGETVKRADVLKKSLLCLFVFAVLLNSSAAFASQDFASNIIIRQQTKTTHGITICAPVDIDLKAYDIIRRTEMKSIDDYAMWLNNTVKYSKDRGSDSWSTPEDTLTRRTGDCEDIAFLNQTFLSVLGYKPKVMALLRSSSPRGHAICIFKENGYYYWFDNTTLKKTSATTMDEFAKHILRHTAYSSLAKIGFEPSRDTVLADK